MTAEHTCLQVISQTKHGRNKQVSPLANWNFESTTVNLKTCMLTKASKLLTRQRAPFDLRLARMSSTTPKVEPGTVPAGYKAHTESSTTILVPESNTAFLNPVQQYNRDLSIAVIRAWNEMRKEEALAKHQHKKERQEKGKGKGKKVEEGTALGQPQSEAGPSKPVGLLIVRSDDTD